MQAIGEDPRVARTREVVYATVRDLVEREGHPAVTHRRVALESGVGRSTLYRHWPDVRTLLLEAEAAARADSVDAPLLGDLRLDLAVDLHRLRLKLSEPRMVALFASLIEQAAFDDAFAAVLQEQIRSNTCRPRETLDRARAEGRLATHLDADDAIALIAGPLFFRRLVMGEPITAEFVEAVLDTVLPEPNAPRSDPA